MRRKGFTKWLTALAMLALVFCLLPVKAEAATANGEYGCSFSFDSMYCPEPCKTQYAPCTALAINSMELRDGTLYVNCTFTLHGEHTLTRTAEFTYFKCTEAYSKEDTSYNTSLKLNRAAGHSVSSWTSTGDGKHTGTCGLCGTTVKEDCSGDSAANCSTAGTCTKCGSTYTPANGHAYVWKNDGTNHWQECAHNAAHKISGGTCAVGTAGTAANCTNAALCGTCGKSFGSKNDTAHAWGGWTHGEVDANHSRICSLNPAHTETKPHDFDYFVGTDDASHLYGTCETCGYMMEAQLVPDTGKSTVYSGRAITPLTIRYSANWVGEKAADTAIAYSGNVDAGEATGTVTLAGKTLTCKFTVSKAPLTITDVTAASRVYDGTANVAITALNFTGKVAGDDVDIKLPTATVAGADADTYSAVTLPAGDRLELTGADKDNYTVTSGAAFSETVTISPREVTAAITAKNGVYGKAAAPVVTFNGLLEQDKSLAVVTYKGTTEKVVDGQKVPYESTAAPAAAGTYTVTAAVSGNNYKLTGTTTASYKISKAPADYDAPKAKKLAYNGAEQALLTAGTVRGSSSTFQYKKEKDTQWGTAVPTAKDAGSDVILWTLAEDENHLGASGKVKVAIEPAVLTIIPDEDQEMTYGEKLPELKYTVKGVIASETPAFTGKLTVYGIHAGTCEISLGNLKLKDKVAFKAANYELKLEKVKFTINRAVLTITAEDQTIPYGSTIKDTEYDTTQVMYEDLVTVTLTPSTTNITYGGRITPEATVEDMDGNDVTDNYILKYKEGKLVIEADLSAIKDLTIENVNAAAAEGIKSLQAALDKADTAKATTAQKKQIEDARVTCAALLVQISEAAKAAQTDAIKNTAGITAENVRFEEETAIRQAISDMEKAMAAFGGNYSDEERKKLDDQTAQLKAAANAIENAKGVIDILAALPETIKAENPQSAGARAAIALLTEHERELVSTSGSGKRMAAVAYKFLSGDGSIWEGKDDLVFEIDGDHTRFVGLLIDGKPVDKEFYETESGSTVITLKKAWLKKASSKDHTITVRFDDGQISGAFRLHEDAFSPGGGFILIFIWVLLAFAAVTLSAAAYLHFKKK